MDNYLEELRALHQIYIDAISICDPIEFQIRQQKLLYALAKYILAPEIDAGMIEKEKAAEAIEKVFDIKKLKKKLKNKEKSK